MKLPKIKVSLEAPVVVAQADPSVREWGVFQYPEIERLGSGVIHVSINNGPDAVLYYGTPRLHALSTDEGRSFTMVKDPPVDRGILLPNGDRVCPIWEPSLKIPDAGWPEPYPAQPYSPYAHDHTIYEAVKIPSQYNCFSIERLARGDAKWCKEIKYPSIPNLARYSTEGLLASIFMQRLRIAPDGGMWGISWQPMITGKNSAEFQPVYLVSNDSGKTFAFLSAIPFKPLPQFDKYYRRRSGWDENDVAFTPDGSVIALIRSENGLASGTAPTYLCRSADGGKTWSEPNFFDTFGVWPVLQPLENGITLACYGREGFYLRATADPSGLEWEERIPLLEPEPDPKDREKIRMETCGYGDILVTAKDEALVVYSHFCWPNPDGVPVKTIFVQRIKAVII